MKGEFFSELPAPWRRTRTAAVSYRHAAPFRAYFDEGSGSEFTVQPQSGELPPSTALGAPIQIAFQPTYYGKPKRARLIIQVRQKRAPLHLVTRAVNQQPIRHIPPPRKQLVRFDFFLRLSISQSNCLSPLLFINQSDCSIIVY